MNELLYSAILPALGWAFYVERRLATLLSIEKKVDKVDVKIDHLIDYALEGKLSNDRTEAARDRSEARRGAEG